MELISISISNLYVMGRERESVFVTKRGGIRGSLHILIILVNTNGDG